MLIFGRYLLTNYLKVLALAVFSFISILLVSRLEEITHYASMGAKPLYLARFILYQIPNILPIAIPISCLLSALILFQKLSHNQELTALRAGGFSLKKIISPILIAGFFLSLTSMYLSSELATASHLATRKMVYELCSINPLLLLQNAKIGKLQDAYVQMEPVRNGEAIQNLIVALHTPSQERMSLCLVKQIGMGNKELKAKQISLISSSAAHAGQAADHLIIENQKSMHASSTELATFLYPKGWKIANDHLKLSLLRIRAAQLKKTIKSGEASAKTKRMYKKCHTEMIRRFSFGLATFTFTLLGVAFGIETRRNRTKRELFIVLGLAALSLVSFFIGKEFDHLIWIASCLFLFPHLLIIAASIWTLRRVNRGIE